MCYTYIYVRNFNKRHIKLVYVYIYIKYIYIIYIIYVMLYGYISYTEGATKTFLQNKLFKCNTSLVQN